MTAPRYYLHRELHAKLLGFLADARTWTNLRPDADELVRDLANVAEAELSPDDPASVLAELLGEIGQASGRTISTDPVLTSLGPAREALREMAPVLGKVVELPRAPGLGTKRVIEAAVAEQLADTKPLSVIIHRLGDDVPHKPVDVWETPLLGDLIEDADTSEVVRVVGRRWVSPSVCVVTVAPIVHGVQGGGDSW